MVEPAHDVKAVQGHAHPETMEYAEGPKVTADTEVAQYLDPSLIISEEENKRLRWKIYKRVLPLLCAGYVTQALDKGTLGSASIMGWQENVGAKGQDYALTSTFLYVGIAVGEPLSNQLARRLPLGKLLGASMIVWTILLLGLTFSLSVAPVFVIRTLLGLFEAFFHPCLVGITVQWFVRQEQILLITIWQSMFALSNFISALLAYGFYQIHHATGEKARGLYPWQWMTLCIAFISLFTSLAVLIWLPDSPAKARWATEEEKVKFVERVRANDQGIKQPKFRKDQALEAAKDPVPWLLVAMVLLQTTIGGGIGTFNNLLINKAFGFSVSTSQLLGIPLAIFQACLYFLCGYLATRFNQTIYTIIAFTIVNVAGTIVLITVVPSASNRGGLLVAFYFMQASQATTPSMWSLLSRNVAGQSKRSIVYAVFFAAAAGGSAIAPQLFQAKWAPRYVNSLYIHLGIYAVFIANLLLLRLIMARRNNKRDANMEENLHANAFEDLTDLQNSEFRYSL